MAPGFIQTLRKQLGDVAVLTGSDARERLCDPFKQTHAGVEMVVRPKTTAEVSFILREAAKVGQKVVVQGGVTGLSGGAWTDPGDIILSLERMRRIEDICPAGRTIVAEAGVTLQELQQAADAAGMLFPVDLGARGTATIGGMIATNAGGNRTLRWGMTRQRLLGLEVVLPNGEVIDAMHKLVKNNTGYDIKHFFVGAEGTLGVVTRAVFKLVPKPSSHEVALIALRDYTDVLEALARAERLQALSAFELMYNDYFAPIAEELGDRAPLKADYPYYVLVEIMGYDEAADRGSFEGYLAQLMEDGLAEDAVLAQSEAQRDGLWSIRESVDVPMRRYAPMLSYDVSLEVGHIDEYVSSLRADLAAAFPEFRTVVLGHIGDNNIHLGISTGSDTVENERAINDLVYAPLAKLRGAMSAEHGIGRTKKDYLHISRSPAEIELMRQIKALIDPGDILNSAVLVPDRDIAASLPKIAS